MVGVALYGMANLIQTFSSEPIIKHTKKCKYCRKHINEKVRQASTPRLEGRADSGIAVSPLHQLYELARWKGRTNPVLNTLT
jgi:hypothetical protein